MKNDLGVEDAQRVARVQRPRCSTPTANGSTFRSGIDSRPVAVIAYFPSFRPGGRRRRCHRVIFVIWPCLLVGLLSCAVATEPGRPGVPIVGSWRLTGRQLAPADGELTGTLSVATQTGATIAGSLDVVETDGRGGQRRSAGPFVGRTIDSTTVDFDVSLAGATRRHVGQVVRDSISGTWIEQSLLGGAPTASGSFVAVRVR